MHDVYIRLIGEAAITWKDRVHFFATVATAMRRVLVDKARELKSLKRGGQQQQADLTLSWFGQDDPGFDLIDLNDALERLKELSPRQARLVELRFFGGLTEDDAAEVLGVSRRTAAGDWAMAKAWLYRELNPRMKPESSSMNRLSMFLVCSWLVGLPTPSRLPIGWATVGLIPIL